MPVNGESKLHFDSIEDTVTAFRESPNTPTTIIAVLRWISRVIVELGCKTGHRAIYIHRLTMHAIGNGDFIVVLDSTDRENEGDLIIAAEDITTQKMAFMVKYTR